MTDPCLICGKPTDQSGQCDRHSVDGVVTRLENFDPQPIEPGYLGDSIAELMSDAAALILSQAEMIADLKGRISDIMHYYRPQS